MEITGNENVAPDEPDDTADLSDDDVGGDGGADDIKGRNRRIQVSLIPFASCVISINFCY